MRAGDWIDQRRHPFDSYDVGAVIPTGYAAYVQVPRITVPLCRILTRHTKTPESTWFALWEGYGYFHSGGMAPMVAVAARPPLARLRTAAKRLQLRLSRPKRLSVNSPRLRLPHRDYFMFTGSVAQGADWQDGPNLWWPDDRAWFVAFEVDLDHAFVGGSIELIDEILATNLGASRTTTEDQL